jgi:hypothetical protein
LAANVPVRRSEPAGHALGRPSRPWARIRRRSRSAANSAVVGGGLRRPSGTKDTARVMICRTGSPGAASRDCALRCPAVCQEKRRWERSCWQHGPDLVQERRQTLAWVCGAILCGRSKSRDGHRLRARAVLGQALSSVRWWCGRGSSGPTVAGHAENGGVLTRSVRSASGESYWSALGLMAIAGRGSLLRLLEGWQAD